MKLTAKVKLHPAATQHHALHAVLEATNAACNTLSALAWEQQTFKQFPLHRLAYKHIRERFGLSAQLTVRAIAKVAESYKVNGAGRRRFRPHGAISYDNRILSWNLANQTVSIWTLAGRQTIPYRAGTRDHQLLTAQRGETDLCLIDGAFYLFTTCEVETPEPVDVKGFLGVDLGIVNIASDSDGQTYAGGQLNGLRRRHRRERASLQARGTHGARRRLKRRRRKERRFATHTNHVISKRIVTVAQDTGRGIALEDLQGIRARVTARRSQRATLHGWSFGQLRAFVTYKAALAGIPVVLVDPRNTSRTCPECGCSDKKNRPNQSSFSCVSCGLAGPADTIAAENIRRAACKPATLPGCQRPVGSARAKLPD